MSEWREFEKELPKYDQRVWAFERDSGAIHFIKYIGSLARDYSHWQPVVFPAPPVIKSPAELWAVSKLQAYGPEIKTSYHHIKNMLIEAYNAGANERSK